jgi:hypothetical protein
MPGEVVLISEDAIGHDGGDEAEYQHRDAILLPVLLAFGIDAQEPVDQPLDFSEQRIEKRAAGLIGIEHMKQIDSKRLGDGHQREDINRELNPAGRSHVCHNPKSVLDE